MGAHFVITCGVMVKQNRDNSSGKRRTIKKVKIFRGEKLKFPKNIVRRKPGSQTRRKEKENTKEWDKRQKKRNVGAVIFGSHIKTSTRGEQVHQGTQNREKGFEQYDNP